jgi:hypothetical protein
LQAEINVGLRQFEDAISLYDKLLAAPPSGSTRHKFAALRSAFAHLAFGDSLFRKSRNPDEDTRHKCREQYVAALTLVQTSGISPDNPLRQQIEQYATAQIAKLDAGLNFIGYRDSYVPIIRPEVLRDLAERRIARAAEAIAKFELFKSKADQIQDQLKNLKFDESIKKLDNEIAAERTAKVNDQQRIADNRVDQIQSQLDSLTSDLFASIGGSLLQGVTAGFLAGQKKKGAEDLIGFAGGTNSLGVAGAAAGIASTIFSYSSRKDDLKAQKEIAEIEASIAARDVQIATLEQQIVGNTLEFLGEKIQRIQKGELNPEVYYAAAEGLRVLAERHLDAAIYHAYLFERAVAFLRLRPELQIIRFDYLPLIQEGLPGNTLTATDRLAADLADVSDANLPLTKFHFLPETYSLRILFPLEFSRFLQTGDIDFTLSLYELNKRRPGVFRERIKRVEVVVKGLIPITGFTGRIIHRGSFLLRDKDTTPEPGAGRFMPTDQQLTEAFGKLKNGATQGVPINGVMPFLLDEDRIELSPDAVLPDLNDPSPEALSPIEGYGPAGDWRLEIENIDLRLITDVGLKITYVIPESDGDLSRRVRGLIAAFEQELAPEGQLDLITPFSLRQQFPDVFATLLKGQTSLSLRREDFPSGIADLKLKTVVAQALSPEKKGVEGVALEITRPGTTLKLARTTRADGFSEDITAPISFLPPPTRFPVEGSYKLRLTKPVKANQLDDLILFLIYEFREV